METFFSLKKVKILNIVFFNQIFFLSNYIQ